MSQNQLQLERDKWKHLFQLKEKDLQAVQAERDGFKSLLKEAVLRMEASLRYTKELEQQLTVAKAKRVSKHSRIFTGADGKSFLGKE